MECNKASGINPNTIKTLCFGYTRPVLLIQTLSWLWPFTHAVYSQWNALPPLSLLEYLAFKAQPQCYLFQEAFLHSSFVSGIFSPPLWARRAFHLPLSFATCHFFLLGNNNSCHFYSDIIGQAIYMHVIIFFLLCPHFTDGQTDEEQRS